MGQAAEEECLRLRRTCLMLIKSYQARQVRIDAKREAILKYLRDEVWSNSENLARVIGVTRTAIYKTLPKLEKQGYIKSHYVPEMKMNIWGITQMGLLYSWGNDEVMETRYGFEPSKVKPLMMNHHLDLQLARFNAEHAGWRNWVPGNQLAKGMVKRPDAVVDDVSKGHRVAIELERTIKTKKRYEVIFSNYLQAIKRGEYHAVHYVCPDHGFATRLKRMFSLIKSVPVASERVQINEKHMARFPVFSLEGWPTSL